MKTSQFFRHRKLRLMALVTASSLILQFIQIVSHPATSNAVAEENTILSSNWRVHEGGVYSIDLSLSSSLRTNPVSTLTVKAGWPNGTWSTCDISEWLQEVDEFKLNFDPYWCYSKDSTEYYLPLRFKIAIGIETPESNWHTTSWHCKSEYCDSELIKSVTISRFSNGKATIRWTLTSLYPASLLNDSYVSFKLCPGANVPDDCAPSRSVSQIRASLGSAVVTWPKSSKGALLDQTIYWKLIGPAGQILDRDRQTDIPRTTDLAVKVSKSGSSIKVTSSGDVLLGGPYGNVLGVNTVTTTIFKNNKLYKKYNSTNRSYTIKNVSSGKWSAEVKVCSGFGCVSKKSNVLTAKYVKPKASSIVATWPQTNNRVSLRVPVQVKNQFGEPMSVSGRAYLEWRLGRTDKWTRLDVVKLKSGKGTLIATVAPYGFYRVTYGKFSDSHLYLN
jgi:hypothetical protein